MTFQSHLWTTTKTDEGFAWKVTGINHGKNSEVLHSGVCATRARAEGQAKAHVMPYRRAAK